MDLFYGLDHPFDGKKRHVKLTDVTSGAGCKRVSPGLLFIMIPARDDCQTIGVNRIDQPVDIIDSAGSEAGQVLL